MNDDDAAWRELADILDRPLHGKPTAGRPASHRGEPAPPIRGRGLVGFMVGLGVGAAVVGVLLAAGWI